MSGFNPNANTWKPSAGAASWSPGGLSATQTSAPTPTPAPTASEVSTEKAETSDTSEIDESDPLWQTVLKISNGDKEKAKKMINDPDSLMKYPEVVALLSTSDGTENMETDEWEENADMEEDAPVAEMEEDLSKNVEKMKIEEVVAPSKPARKEEVAIVEEIDPREHFNLVFIGHVDAGKSTLSGNILYLTDNVDKRTIERYEREAKERNRESWFLAFIMDTNEEERAKGKTVEVGRAQFDTDFKRYTILDAPGHKNYVPNMIMGASQADIAVLVISARKGEFETGFDRGGQTREHALLAKTLGVSYMVVVINKMDESTVNWEKSRFDECVKKLRPFLKSCGFIIKREVKFLPISGLSGANVIKEVDPSVCPWWKKCVDAGENNTCASTLVGLLDTLKIEGRDANAPIRMPIMDRYNDRGTIAMGKIESGKIRTGMKVHVMPTRNVYKVDALWSNEEPVKSASPGENVLVKLNGCGTEDILKGFVICSEPPCRAVDKLICQIGLMDMPESTKIFTAGFQAMFHAHTAEEECTVTKLFETTNAKGQVNKTPRFANIGMKVICMVQLERTVPLETFENMAFLGRFTLRTEGKTIAIGKVIKLPPKKQ